MLAGPTPVTMRRTTNTSNAMNSKHHHRHHPTPAERRANLSRRRFLKGLGACIALPAMESLMPRGLMAAEAHAAATGAAMAPAATGAPLRTACVYFRNGAIPASFWPSGEG